MTQIDVKEAQAHLLELIEQAVEGEEIIITKNNHPVVKLVAAIEAPEEGHRQFGSAKGLITIADDFDEPLTDFAEYM